MSNEFYNYGNSLTSHTTARSADVVTELQAVSTGLDKLPTEAEQKRGTTSYAVDTGIADAYVVALPYTPAAYSEGMVVNCRIINANTGPSTLNVNTLGDVVIKNQDGTDLLEDDLPAGSLPTFRHNGTLFVLTSERGGDTAAAAASAAAAAISETNAATSETNAATSATNAATSETNAAASEAAAQAAVNGLKWKPSAKAATTANITLSGAQTIDGISLVADDICLVKNQSAPAENGLYTVSASAWTRIPEMDTWDEVPSAANIVEEGSVNADVIFLCTSDQGGTLETTAITWAVYGNVSTSDIGVTIQGFDAGISATPHVQGKHTIWVPVDAMRPTVTNGCSVLRDFETTAGNPDFKVRDFGGAADEHAQFAIMMPKSWNESTVTFRAAYGVSDAAATHGTDTVAWALQAISVVDDASIDQAFGTAVAVVDTTPGTVEDQAITAESGAITIASVAVDTITYFRAFRDVSADDMTEDARLMGYQVFITTNAGDDT